MHRFLLIFVIALATLNFSPAARAQNGEFTSGIQLRLKNSLPEKVDYYFTPEGGSPKLAGSLQPGAGIDVKSQPGLVWLFAQNRKPFQKYQTRDELFQQLTIAPAGQQKKPLVANAYQRPLKSAQSAASSNSNNAPATDTKSASKPAAKQDEKAAANPHGMVWTTSSSEGGEGTMFTLMLAVPETDNSQVFAACTSMPVGLIHLVVGWDVNDMVTGQAAQIRFAGSGFDRTFRGKAMVDDSGERLNGVEFSVKAEDPLWAQFKSVQSVRYNVGGKGSATLGLNGLSKPLNTFLTRCLSLTDDNLDPVASEPGPASTSQGFKSFRAKSWGGIVRAGPGTEFAKVTSLREGDPITAIERSKQQLDGFPWFKIRYGQNKTGYQWGGVICPVGKPVPGTFEQCQ